MKKENNLDERQEQILLNIEHKVCCLAFWLLCIVIVAQVLMGGYLDHILGEVICLGVISVYTLIECLKNGIWDRNRNPSSGMNLVYSLTAGLIVGILACIQLTRLERPNILSASLILGLLVFGLSFAVLNLCSAIYKRRREKLEEE